MLSTPSTDFGISKFNPGIFIVSESSNSPSWIAFTILLVVGISNLEPTPNGPPVQPVLTKKLLNQTFLFALLKVQHIY